jgi:hypothetical protein
LGDIGAHVKFQNPMITPSWRKVTSGERERKKQTPLIVVT